MNIVTTNQVALSPSDFADVCKAIELGAGEYISTWGKSGVTFNDAFAVPGMKVMLTEQHRRRGAKGYHVVENGIPVCYISLNAHAKKIWGTWHPAIMSRGKVLFPARGVDGLVTSAVHEVIEALCDPDIKQFSEPDTKGHQWLMEPEDPVDGIWHMIVVNAHQVVLSDFVYPSFYKKDGVAPFDFAGAVKAPFTIPVKTGYGFWRNLLGGFIKV